MANLQDLGAIAGDAAFQNRCMEALQQAAVNVAAEGDNVTNHPQREAYALQVIGQQSSISPKVVAEVVLTNSTIAAEATVGSLPGCTAIPDSDILFAVNSLFNDLAGVVT